MNVFTIGKFEDSELGTVYGIFSGNVLIHKEYSKSASERITQKLNGGEMLADIISDWLSFYDTERYEQLAASRQVKLSCLQQKHEKLFSENCYQKQYISTLQEKLKVLKEKATLEKNSIENVEGFAKKFDLSIIDAAQLKVLIDDILPMKFTHVSQLSKYVVNNDLTKKFPSITGDMEFCRGGRFSHTQQGALRRDVYNIIRYHLGLKSDGSDAIPSKFTATQEQ